MPPSISAPTWRTRLREDENEPSPATPPRLATTRRPAEPSACTRLDHHLDQVALDACRHATASAWSDEPRGPTNDRVLYVGMNEDSMEIEGRALAARGIGLTRIESEATSAVMFRGATYNLSTEMGAQIFAAAVAREHGLDRKQMVALANAISNAVPSGRDELARIALQWAPAESGGTIPSRLILSGHSAGGAIWGNASQFELESVRMLGTVLRKAAEQIEDIQISSCFGEREVQGSSKWVAAFPNLKSLWADRGFAPAAPTSHLLDWEAATRGRTARLGESFVAAHSPATAWSINGGIVNAGLSIDERRSLVRSADGRFAAYLSGERPIKSAHQPDADRDYGAYQMLASHREAGAGERARAASRAQQMLRLRFYEESIRSEFSRKHGSVISAAFERVGLLRTDFGSLSRKDALRVIDAFREKVGQHPTAPGTARATSLLDGLKDLRPDAIPEGWCH